MDFWTIAKRLLSPTAGLKSCAHLCPTYTLPEGESKHVVRWLRHAKGDAVVLVDGRRGGRYTTTVADATSAAHSLAEKSMVNFRSTRLRHFKKYWLGPNV